MHCKATKVLGSRMQHGNANEMLGLSDAMKTTRSPQRRACAPQRKQNARTVGCDEDNAQPAAACALHSNEGLGTWAAIAAMRSPQRRTHCKASEKPGLSDATKTARSPQRLQSNEVRPSIRQQPGNAQPTAAHALQRYEILLIDPWLTHDARSCPLWHSQFGYVIWYLYYQTNEISVANRQRLLRKKVG